MTAATLSRLPISAGGALAGSLARGARWSLAHAMELAAWGLAQFMRAPVAITCVVAITGFSVLAGSNALFMQTGRHPAPLFFSPRPAAIPVKPVIPATRPRPQPAAIDRETTGSVSPRAVNEALGTEEVRALQKKLAELDLFKGTLDGLFGRRTSTAIKAFEMKVGMKPTGKLTRRIVDVVLAAPVPGAQPLPPAAVPQPAPALLAAAPAAPRPVAQAPTLAVASATPVPLAPRHLMVPTTVITAPAPAASETLVPLRPATDALPAAAAPSDATVAQALPPVAPATAATARPAPTTQVASIAPMSDAPETLPAPDPIAAAPVAPAATVATAAPAAAAAAVPGHPGETVMAMNNPSEATPPAGNPAALNVETTAAQRLAAQMGTLPPQAPGAMASINTSSDPGDGAGSTDPVLITKIQRGLASLGFLGAKIDGVPGEGTAKAIRNFEVFYDYKVTGLATPQLLNLLIQHGAVI